MSYQAKYRALGAAVSALLLALGASGKPAAAGSVGGMTSPTVPTASWILQFGTDKQDSLEAIATDADGNVIGVGAATGPFARPPKPVKPWDNYDALAVKVSPAGSIVWKRQFDASISDFAYGVATDADGHVYMVGTTAGALGGPKQGIVDAFVVKLDANGQDIWRQQPGTEAGDEAVAVTTDPDGNVIVVGNTKGALGGAEKGDAEDQDCWVIKFDSQGRYLWKRQPGTPEYEYVGGVATDAAGNIYFSGSTLGSLGGPQRGKWYDPFLIKFDPQGRILWKRQPGTPEDDTAGRVATDSAGNVILVGTTAGRLGGDPKGDYDAFVIKFDGDGRVLWRRQPGSSAVDTAGSIAIGTDDSIFLLGSTEGAMGTPNQGLSDVFMIRFDADGHTLWRRQIGSADRDYGSGVALGPDNAAFIGGSTLGQLGDQMFGGYGDAFVISYPGDAAQP